jgi:hypothetical protein
VTILADAGLPMLFIDLPAMLCALVPVIIAEFLVARNVLGVRPGKAFEGVAIANLVSTLFGFPLLWILLVVLDFCLGGGGAHGLGTLWGRVYAVTVQAPWLIPYESDFYWMVPIAGLYLLVPAFFVSVFLERWICRKIWKDQKAEDVRKFSWKAHFVSYSVLLVVSVFYYRLISKHG